MLELKRQKPFNMTERMVTEETTILSTVDKAVQTKSQESFLVSDPNSHDESGSQFALIVVKEKTKEVFGIIHKSDNPVIQVQQIRKTEKLELIA